MEDQQILIAVVVIAVLALVGRLLINKGVKKGINWRKVGMIGGVMVVFMLTFMLYNPERMRLWWKGEATLSEGKSESIAGRKPGDDIPRLRSTDEIVGEIYYTIVPDSMHFTGFYRVKDLRTLEDNVDRKVQEGETSHGPAQVIERKTSAFELTKNPQDEEKYLPVYVAVFGDGTKVVTLMEERDAELEVKPISVLRPVDDTIRRVLRNEGDESVITDFYLLAYDEQHGNRSYTETLVDRCIAGLAMAIAAAFVFMIVWRKR